MESVNPVRSSLLASPRPAQRERTGPRLELGRVEALARRLADLWSELPMSGGERVPQATDELVSMARENVRL
jgi:hypothetical protein